MKTLISILTKKFHAAIEAAYPQLKEQNIPLEVVQSTNDKFGHYQCNSAMKLTKLVGLKPREIAERLIANLECKDDCGSLLVQELAIAGPGFINITIDPQFLSKYIDQILKLPHLGIDAPEHSQRIIIDFSSPNTAKEMHVGHLRSTIIGDCLSRLFEFLGHDVLRLNHIGDWGTAFGIEDLPDGW